ncbi:dTMP kinase [Catenovulum sp. SM1970]|uniref:dTMP kinase n=1 Tax=Marinifaba aquimaris TaxID=2741323 RepID=UPI001571F7CA|nr:dTMP kinase [Marinifaba aquimaris]NTS77964.1 dTMP kinase [Marinifaba aquimaris]
MSGKFIVIEGLEGAGKSTAISAVTQWLNDKGIAFSQTREPGGTALAEELRTLVKQVRDDEKVTAEAELLIMYAARVQLIDNVIKPELNKGNWVIGDRHDLSSRAYQGGGRGISDELIEPVRNAVLKGFKPELTLYLDIDPKIGLARARARGELDRIELEELTFFENTRAKYQQIASQDESIVSINAMQTIDEVARDIRKALDDFYQCMS